MWDEHLEAYACTSIGHVRERNEDAAMLLKGVPVFVVADGMGGESAGEFASQQVVSEVRKAIDEAEMTPAQLESAIIRAAFNTNSWIKSYAKEHGYKGMGTTLASLQFNPWNPSMATTFHAGDSRIYRFREDRLEQLTDDHVLRLNQNRLTNALGIGKGLFLERQSIDVQAEDIFILCTDGLSHEVPEHEIASFCQMHVHDSAVSLCRSLVTMALDSGGRDNVTVIVVRVLHLPCEYEPSENELNEECERHLENIRILSNGFHLAEK